MRGSSRVPPLGMTQEEVSRAFSTSPMRRAKPRGLNRNAAVVPGSVGTTDDVGLLTRVCNEESDAMVREHAAWALALLQGPA